MSVEPTGLCSSGSRSGSGSGSGSGSSDCLSPNWISGLQESAASLTQCKSHAEITAHLSSELVTFREDFQEGVSLLLDAESKQHQITCITFLQAVREVFSVCRSDEHFKRICDESDTVDSVLESRLQQLYEVGREAFMTVLKQFHENDSEAADENVLCPMVEVASILSLLDFSAFVNAVKVLKHLIIALERTSEDTETILSVDMSSLLLAFIIKGEALLDKISTTLLTLGSKCEGDSADLKRLIFIMQHMTLISCTDVKISIQWTNMSKFLSGCLKLNSYDIVKGSGKFQARITNNIPGLTEKIFDMILKTSEGIFVGYAEYLISPQETGDEDMLLVQSELCRKFHDNNHVVRRPWFPKDNYTNLFLACLKTSRSCPEFFLSDTGFPGPQPEGRDISCLSPYQFIVCFVVCASPEDFQYIEASLFDIIAEETPKHLLGTLDWAKQIASDVWCFLARYESPGACYSQLSILLKLCLEEKGGRPSIWPYLSQLVARLSRFLAKQDMTSLTKEYNPALDLRPWCLIDVRGCTADFRRSVISLCLAKVKELSEGEIKDQKLDTYVASLSILMSLDLLSNEEKKVLFENLYLIWLMLEKGVFVANKSPKIAEFLVALTKLTYEYYTTLSTDLPVKRATTILRCMADVGKYCAHESYMIYAVIKVAEAAYGVVPDDVLCTVLQPLLVASSGDALCQWRLLKLYSKLCDDALKSYCEPNVHNLVQDVRDRNEPRAEEFLNGTVRVMKILISETSAQKKAADFTYDKLCAVLDQAISSVQQQDLSDQKVNMVFSELKSIKKKIKA